MSIEAIAALQRGADFVYRADRTSEAFLPSDIHEKVRGHFYDMMADLGLAGPIAYLQAQHGAMQTGITGATVNPSSFEDTRAIDLVKQQDNSRTI